MESRRALEERIREVAAQQHGLITRGQLLNVGVTADSVRWRVRSGLIEPLHRGVYRVGPVVAPRSHEMAAVLACGDGAVVSHGSGAFVWQAGPDPGRQAPVDVTVPGVERGRGRPGVRMRRVGDLRADETTVLDGVPVTSLARTMLDLAAETSPTAMAGILALAMRNHESLGGDLVALMSRHRKRPGMPLMRVLLRDDSAPVLTRSEAEDRMLELVRRAQLPRPEANVRLDGYEIDLLWRRQRLVVEVDGFAYHSSRARFENDRRRDATLAARGFRVMRVTYRQITEEPEAMLIRLAQAMMQPSPG